MLTSSAILSDASADDLLPTDGLDNSMIIESFAFGFLPSSSNFGEDANSGSTALCSNFPLRKCYYKCIQQQKTNYLNDSTDSLLPLLVSLRYRGLDDKNCLEKRKLADSHSNVGNRAHKAA